MIILLFLHKQFYENTKKVTYNISLTFTSSKVKVFSNTLFHNNVELCEDIRILLKGGEGLNWITCFSFNISTFRCQQNPKRINDIQNYKHTTRF